MPEVDPVAGRGEGAIRGRRRRVGSAGGRGRWTPSGRPSTACRTTELGDEDLAAEDEWWKKTSQDVAAVFGRHSSRNQVALETERSSSARAIEGARPWSRVPPPTGAARSSVRIAHTPAGRRTTVAVTVTHPSECCVEIRWNRVDDRHGHLARSVDSGELAHALQALGDEYDPYEPAEQALAAAAHTTHLARLLEARAAVLVVHLHDDHKLSCARSPRPSTATRRSSPWSAASATRATGTSRAVERGRRLARTHVLWFLFLHQVGPQPRW
ncbi:hypothetical protein OG413_46330 [Streptomyces sp. NBC_01433]|uniref:hypothetical protein n=1 Tax=Streptomyces sp. NBC_01433 TaxID=2903864 RepID=UPI002256B347|nr:hypothetical protein [Streptomyces sp. NBC_01433]MCX4682606.1 hypothetical protein [Streptomyces sp. NBC_01433]